MFLCLGMTDDYLCLYRHFSFPGLLIDWVWNIFPYWIEFLKNLENLEKKGQFQFLWVTKVECMF